MIRRPAALCILDGWGLAADGPANAIALARTPVWDRLAGGFPNARIAASGEAVGLPAGQMGNSEVGHMTIGSGRAVLQDLPRIDAAIRDGSLAASPVLGRFVARLRRSGGRCHLAGLASPGGVHAHTAHMLALARCIAGAGVPVAVHAFLDGRDTPPRSARDHIAAFEAAAAAGPPGVTVATVCGRYFAMDRDGNWERTARAFAATARAEGVRAESAAAAVEASYAANAGDEFVAPTVIDGYGGMEDGDGFVMANFRGDRARQILAALLAPDFPAFARGRPPAFAAAAGMTRYSESLDARMEILFPPVEPRDTLGALVATAGLRQFRAAETEKYAHVTFFLNGGREEPFPGEARSLAPSPKVATYDLAPARCRRRRWPRGWRQLWRAAGWTSPPSISPMPTWWATPATSAPLSLRSRRWTPPSGASLRRFAPPGGHCSSQPIMATPSVCAMRKPARRTRRTPPTRRRRCSSGRRRGRGLRDGGLADVAPTMLELLGLDRPDSMTGRSLLAPPRVAKGRRGAA